MADVRTLKLNLLDVDQFSRSLDRADNQTKGFAGNLKKYGKIAAGAFATAAVAAGTYAVKLGVDSVEAAIEDEQSQKTLAKTLKTRPKPQTHKSKVSRIMLERNSYL
jgi:hypothetical protein